VDEPGDASETRYSGRGGKATYRIIFDEDTEVTGHIALRLWIEARSEGSDVPDDMALCVVADKIDERGKRVRFYGAVGCKDEAITKGYLLASKRALDEEASTPWRPVLAMDRVDPITVGEVYEVEVALNPTSVSFAAGEALELVIASHEVTPTPPLKKDVSCNRGWHVVHTGGERPSSITLPVV
jgi:hypothetical protein